MATHSDWRPQEAEALFAPYAMHSADSAGRKHAEPAHAYRGQYQRDRDRIVHCAAFRHLAHKTQVLAGDLGDYHRTRLTHTLEVSSIARTLARALGLNEDLVEALSLLHDIGHPPFGHAGEDVLDDCLQGEGGFSHNRQALRIVELLESRYPEFPGLNLSQEVLEGQAHRVQKGGAGERPLLEVQVVDAADSIAYDTHDADDALEVGLITLDELLETSLWSAAAERARHRHANLPPLMFRRVAVRELINVLVGDVLQATRARLAEGRIDSVSAVRRADTLVAPSAALAREKQQLEKFLHARVYRHEQVLGRRDAAQRALREMFDRFASRPSLLPPQVLAMSETEGLRRSIADYLSGMTDRFAVEEHRRQGREVERPSTAAGDC